MPCTIYIYDSRYVHVASSQPVRLLVKNGYGVPHAAIGGQRLDNILQLEVGCWD